MIEISTSSFEYLGLFYAGYNVADPLNGTFMLLLTFSMAAVWFVCGSAGDQREGRSHSGQVLFP